MDGGGAMVGRWWGDGGVDWWIVLVTARRTHLPSLPAGCDSGKIRPPPCACTGSPASSVQIVPDVIVASSGVGVAAAAAVHAAKSVNGVNMLFIFASLLA